MLSIEATYLGKQIRNSNKNLMIFLAIMLFLILGSCGYFILFCSVQSFGILLSGKYSFLIQKLLIFSPGLILGIGVFFAYQLHYQICLQENLTLHPDFQSLSHVGSATQLLNQIEEELQLGLFEKYGSIQVTRSFLIWQGVFQTHFCLIKDIICIQEKEEIFHPVTIFAVILFQIPGLLLTAIINLILFQKRPMSSCVFSLFHGQKICIRAQQKQITTLRSHPAFFHLHPKNSTSFHR